MKKFFVTIGFLLGVFFYLYSSVWAEECYCVQFGSFSSKGRAQMQYAEIVSHFGDEIRDFLRIEYLGPDYTVCAGKYQDYKTANYYLEKFQSRYPLAIIIRSDYLPERIVVANAAPHLIGTSSNSGNRQAEFAAIVTQAGKVHEAVSAVVQKKVTTGITTDDAPEFVPLVVDLQEVNNVRALFSVSVISLLILLLMLLFVSLKKRVNGRQMKETSPVDADRFSGVSNGAVSDPLLEENRFTILARLQQNPPTNIHEACAIIENITGAQHRLEDVRRFIKSLGHLT